MPKVLLTKAQERQERASRVLKISIMDSIRISNSYPKDGDAVWNIEQTD